MKRRLALLLAAAVSRVGIAIPGIDPEQPAPAQELPTLIGELAEKDFPQASDYRAMAEQTLQLGQGSKQLGSPLPESVLRDGIAAAEAGRALNPMAANWDQLERDLKGLLEEQQEQQNQSQQGQDDQQKKQDGEEGEKQEQQGSSGQEQGEQEQNAADQQEQQQSEGGGSEGQQQPDPSPQEGDTQQSGEDGQDSDKPMQDGSKMGELDQQEKSGQPALDHDEDYEGESTMKPPEQMQSVGGQQENGQQLEASAAAIQQKLEQLKQQDDPAKLFMILEQAQSGAKPKKQTNTKDW